MRISDWSSDVCSSDLARFGTLVKIAAPTQFTEQCRAQQESDANCRQVPMRYAHIAFVKPVGVDQCMGDRKCCRAFMVIDDDDVDACRTRHVQSIEGLRPAIDGNDQGGAALRQANQDRKSNSMNSRHK